MLDSAGEFSLDPVAAASKLQNSGLRPEYWILHWIQASVSAGATLIEGGRAGDSVFLCNNAPPLSKEELTSLPDPVTALGRVGPLSYYARSIHGLIGGKPQTIWFGSSAASTMRLPVQKELELDSKPGQNNWIRVKGFAQSTKLTLPGRLQSIFRSVYRRLGPEGLLVQDRCRFCSVAVIWNGIPVNRPLISSPASLRSGRVSFSPEQEMDGAAYFFSDTEFRGAIPTFPCTHGIRLIWLKGDPDEPEGWKTLSTTGHSPLKLFSRSPIPEVQKEAPALPSLWCGGQQMLGCTVMFQRAANEPAACRVVADGVSYFWIPIPDQRGYRVVLAGNHLNFDLSGLRVVADKNLEGSIALINDLISRWITILYP